MFLFVVLFVTCQNGELESELEGVVGSEVIVILVQTVRDAPDIVRPQVMFFFACCFVFLVFLFLFCFVLLAVVTKGKRKKRNFKMN